MNKISTREFQQILEHFGVDRIIAALPQNEVCKVLGLVCLKDLTTELDIGYDKFRRYMEMGTIPFPEVRIRRRSYYTTGEAEMIRKQLRKALPR